MKITRNKLIKLLTDNYIEYMRVSNCDQLAQDALDWLDADTCTPLCTPKEGGKCLFEITGDDFDD